MRGETIKPSSANLIAGSKRRAQGSWPCLRWVSSSMRSTPGTPTESPPEAASGQLINVPSALRNKSLVTLAGAVSRPSKDSIAPLVALKCSKKPPPPIPEDCGSTRPSTICAEIAASMAEPPASSISRPARAAWGLATATMPCLAVAGKTVESSSSARALLSKIV